MKPIFHQLMSGMSPGDAVSNHAFFIQKALKEAGVHSEIFSEIINPSLSSKVLPLESFVPSDKINIIHHLCQSSAATDVVRAVNVKSKTLIYHNITPSHFFTLYDEKTANLCEKGRAQTPELTETYDKVYGDSKYNCDELLSYGFIAPKILPISFDFDEYSQEPCQKTIEKYDDKDIKNILFVGRMAPNKKIEEVVKNFYYYNKYINNKSRLILIGSNMGSQDIYFRNLNKMISLLNLEKDVEFKSNLSFKKIIAYYKIADLFFCASEHEGFCVPLLESMFFSLPILAYNSSAVPETLGDAGVIFRDKNYKQTALLINEIITNQKLKEQIIINGQKRLQFFHPNKIRKLILDELLN